MIVTKGIKFSTLMRMSGHHFVWLLAFTGAVAAGYHYKILDMAIPWLPISVIGTAVAFYVGFKNNQAYDRMWEARKIWGGIVNDSRTWGMMVDSFVTNQFTENPQSENQLKEIKKRLIYRHIGWLYAHRSQLLVPTSWEHVSQSGHIGKSAEYYQRNFGVGLLHDDDSGTNLKQFLPSNEYEALVNAQNTATQIVNEQSRDLVKLREQGLLNDFRHMEMEKVLRSFYEQQGKNERIKKFPLPRQYANMSRYFVAIFIFLLPFGMIPELVKIENWRFWLSVPLTTLIGWIYVMMEIVGDYSENPFQGMANDIPMMSLCRTIEIDLREMIGEKELPPAIHAKDGILM